jgi:hypothetical protein
MELMKDIHDIFIENPLTRSEESQRKTIKARGLISI